MKLDRVKENPILKANPKNTWEELCVLNPAVIYNNEDETFYMFYYHIENHEEFMEDMMKLTRPYP